MLQKLTIDNVVIDVKTLEAVVFQGRHTGAELAGLDMHFFSLQDDVIDELCEKEYVTVDDPINNRRYKATIFTKSTSYEVGKRGKSYTVELRELDSAPEYSQLEINGIVFNIISRTEPIQEDQSLSIFAILRLSDYEFKTIRDIYKNREVVHVKRIGVDQEPATFELGGTYWSKHIEESGVFYKQSASFFSPNLPRSKPLLASPVIQNSTMDLSFQTTVRLEALIFELTRLKVISEERKEALLGKEIKSLLPEERFEEIGWAFTKVEDAEEYL